MKRNELTIANHIFSDLKPCYFLKKALASSRVISTNQAVFMKFTTGKSFKSFQLSNYVTYWNAQTNSFKNQNNYLAEIDDQIK